MSKSDESEPYFPYIPDSDTWTCETKLIVTVKTTDLIHRFFSGSLTHEHHTPIWSPKTKFPTA